MCSRVLWCLAADRDRLARLGHHACLSHILACPWAPGGATATTQRPAHCDGRAYLLKPDVPSVQQLVDEVLLRLPTAPPTTCCGIEHPIAAEHRQSRRRPSLGTPAWSAQQRGRESSTSTALWSRPPAPTHAGSPAHTSSR
ncbi:hypothetical protein BDU57DRAFT_329925 [Ampelomyces quisqualis]|uniref:Uncharacterized protein n=1 Tax=Ampelomyces quisqualis TaxID=50730 RepID=A0A6A5QEW7_AMPQU|nr:hypothetical protein BDU57DRAFT_329925 [Ampelomyces quisqualis]